MQRVLIVEDELHLAEVLQFNLEAEGFDAQIVESGEGALERLLGGSDPRFDLVVLDVMLPGIDGFAVVTELRLRKQFVPVLMLTARGRPEDVLKGFAAGADDYLPKPTELKRIFRRFYRTPALGAVRTKGSGLGLFIVRSVAKNHGGRAFAESAGAGQGSTLTIVLPRAPGA